MNVAAAQLALLDKVPTGLLCLLFVLVIVIVAQIGLTVFHRFYSPHKLLQSNEVAGIFFGAIGLIYSLVLAFVIIAVWENYEDLNKTISAEADKINSILAHTSTLPDSLQQPIKTALISYCRQVVEQEWHMNHSLDKYQPSAIPDLRLMLLTYEPHNLTEINIFAGLDKDLSNISDLRRQRLNHNRSQVPDLVWAILYAGSGLLILFSFFFNVPSLLHKRIYLTFLSAYIAMCMFLVYTLDQPFYGKVQASKQPYTNLLMGLQEYNTDTITKN